MALDKFIKDPDATLDYRKDWTAWLAQFSDTITASTWIVPMGLTQPDDQDPTFTDTTATVWLAGGTLGKSYAVTNRITTAGGRINDGSFQVVIKAT